MRSRIQTTATFEGHWKDYGSGLSGIRLAYFAVGAGLALLVFAVSVVSVPATIDRHATASQAVCARIEAVRRNPVARLVWAALIVALTAIGFAMAPLGIVVVIPLLGHATWQA